MTKINLNLLHDARKTRANLRWSRIPEYRNASIRDAVVMAADLMRQLAHERRENSGTIDRRYEAAFQR